MRRSFLKLAKSYSSTVKTFMAFSIGGSEPKRVEFELFGKQCPTAVENFAKLCSGENALPPAAASDSIDQQGFSDQFLPQLTYRNSSIHRVMKGFCIQGGDLVNERGGSQLSIFGPTFDAPDEVKASKFDKKYLVGTAVSAPHLNGSQFFILTAPKAPHLDGTCICFGRVSKGAEVIAEIESIPTNFEGRPKVPVKIVDSGEL